MQSKATTPTPTVLRDPAMMAELVRSQIYASLDEIQDFTIRAKKMRDLVRLAEEVGDDAAADAGRGALNGLATAATA
jgi:hypothetical protein